MQLCCTARIEWKSPWRRFARRNQTHDLHKRKFIFTALRYKIRHRNDLLFIQSQAPASKHPVFNRSICSFPVPRARIRYIKICKETSFMHEIHRCSSPPTTQTGLRGGKLFCFVHLYFSFFINLTRLN